LSTKQFSKYQRSAPKCRFAAFCLFYDKFNNLTGKIQLGKLQQIGAFDQAKMEQEQRSLMLTGDFFKKI